MSTDQARALRSLTIAAVVMMLAVALNGVPVAGQGLAADDGAVLLLTARGGHTATLLADDYVLLACCSC